MSSQFLDSHSNIEFKYFLPGVNYIMNHKTMDAIFMHGVWKEKSS